jgi:hypothetical protein
MLDGPWAAGTWTGMGAPGMLDWNRILFDRYVEVRNNTTIYSIEFRTVGEGGIYPSTRW